MGPVSAEVEIDVPRRRVFEAISDLSLRAGFTDHFISELRLTRIESSGVGAGARFRLAVPPRAVWADTTVVELAEPCRVIERGRCGRANRIPLSIAWQIDEGPGALTTVRVSQWTEPSNPVDRAIELFGASSVWLERDWRQALRRLRNLLESGAIGDGRVAVAGGNRHPTGIA